MSILQFDDELIMKFDYRKHLFMMLS